MQSICQQDLRRRSSSFKKAFLILLGLGAIPIGCNEMPGKHEVVISGVKYVIPDSDVDSVQMSSDGRPYVRISLVASRPRFLMIHSSNMDRPNKQGAGVPTVVNVNDVPGEYSVIRNEDLVVVCEPGRLAGFNCGFVLQDHGAKWSVIFNSDDLAKLSAIKSAAEQLLLSYRS